MSMNSLQDLYEDQLKDLYSAETMLIKALPKMAKAASTPQLQKAFEQHLEQTREHAERIEQVMKEINSSPKGKKCHAMEGLIEEAEEVIKEKGADPKVKDAGLIAAAQKVEHYEIASYGCVRTYADRLGFKNSARLLERTLSEEKKADEKLNIIAETNVNAMVQKNDTKTKAAGKPGAKSLSVRSTGSRSSGTRTASGSRSAAASTKKR
jgi:ferritin-like metal-binding protein YciE